MAALTDVIGRIARGFLTERTGDDQQIQPLFDDDRFQNVVLKIQHCRSIIDEPTSFPDSFLCAALTLGDLRSMERDPMREELIDKLELRRNIELIDQEHFPFFPRLQEISYEILEEVSLIFLQLENTVRQFHRSPLADALITDQEFISIPQEKLRGRQDLRVFTFRLNHIFAKQPRLIVQLARIPIPYVSNRALLDCSAAKLRLLSCGYLNLHAPNIIPEAYGLLDDDQVKELNFSKMGAEQIRACLQGGVNDESTIERRYALLSSDQLRDTINKSPYGYLLQKIPLSCYVKIPLSDIGEESIALLFCDESLSEMRQKERINAVSIDQVNAALPRLPPLFIRHLSDEQIQGLDYEKTSKKQLEAGFCSLCQREEERKERIQQIPLTSIAPVVAKVGPSFTRYFSPEQRALL